MPFVATANRYCLRYGDNAKYVSWYFVCGELDGDKMAHNSRELDRYFGRNSDNTVVEYLGRGYEPFGDELQRLFDWMGRRQRKMPQEFDCDTMRPWDNYFWWVEVADMPDKSMVAAGQLAATPLRPAVPGPRQARPEQQGRRLLAIRPNNRLARPRVRRLQQTNPRRTEKPPHEPRRHRGHSQPERPLRRRPHPRRTATPLLGQSRVGRRQAVEYRRPLKSPVSQLVSTKSRGAI